MGDPTVLLLRAQSLCGPPWAFPAITAARLPCSAGVVVLPVQPILWLRSDIVLAKSTIVISTSKTDYIFVTEEAWAKCQEAYGATIEGRKLCVKPGASAQEALRSMLDSLLGLYEAKSPDGLQREGLPKVRAQAVLEYLAVNQMRKVLTGLTGEHRSMR